LVNGDDDDDQKHGDKYGVNVNNYGDDDDNRKYTRGDISYTSHSTQKNDESALSALL